MEMLRSTQEKILGTSQDITMIMISRIFARSRYLILVKLLPRLLLSFHGTSFAYQAVSPYVEKHRASEFFASGWDEKNLLTLVALQGDVSSKNTSEDDTRGNGTVEMIEFFDKISHELSPSDSSPEMAIISGSSHIRFDGTYSLGDDDSERKVIAFNQPNDLNHPPDKEYVSNLAPFILSWDYNQHSV